MSETYIGSETVEPEGYMQPTRYRIHCECLRCGEAYSWIAKSPGGKDRPCPRKACREDALNEEIERRAYNMARIIETQTPPGHIGDKPIVQAIDKTAEIVMADHGLTNLKDNIRSGESMAPSLPAPQQRQADNFFAKAPSSPRGTMASRRAELLGRRAMAGDFRNMAVNPAALTPGSSGEAPLRHVRSEKIN